MIEEQKKKIIAKVKLTGWKSMMNGTRIQQVLLDLHSLLPDANIEAWIRDNPIPPHWYWIPSRDDDDDGDDKEVGYWEFAKSYLQRQWYAAALIDKEDWDDAEKNGFLNVLQHDEVEDALISLIDILDSQTPDIFTYTYRKSEQELAAMANEFEQIFLNKPTEPPIAEVEEGE